MVTLSRETREGRGINIGVLGLLVLLRVSGETIYLLVLGGFAGRV